MTPLEIVVHPARARPLKTAAVLLYVGLASWFLGGTLLAPWVGAVPLAGACAVFGLLVVLLQKWFFPTRFHFDDDGVEVRGRRYAWARFRGWRRERGGLFLSPFSDPARFDNFRGLFLFLDNFVVSMSDSTKNGDISREAQIRVQALLEEKICADADRAPGA